MAENREENTNSGEIEAKFQQELSEIALLEEQSQSELQKLTQRNATVSTHLKQVQSQIDEMPPSDIRAAYDAALESQQRLTLMRGQMDKLQSEKQHIERFLASLQEMETSNQSGKAIQADGGGPDSSVRALIHAQESERQRLSRQMHDGPAQALSNIVLQAEIAKRLFEVDPEQAREELENLKNSASATFQKIRDFISDLRPVILDELGLLPTIERYSASYAKKSGLDIDVSGGTSDRSLESYLEVLILRTVQEIISGSDLHDQASSMKVQLDIGDREVSVVIEDDGRGFDSPNLPEDSAMLVKTISDRVEMLGGSFDVQSTPGSGSRFSFSIPAAFSSA